MGMRKRCNNPNFDEWAQYGGRGIGVCKEWSDKFENFYEWAIANGYRDDLTIERIDVNGNYEPDNCTWIPMKEQQKNKTNTIYVEVNGSKISLIDLALKYNIPQKTMHRRYYRNLERKGIVDIEKLIAPIQSNKTAFRYRKQEN